MKTITIATAKGGSGKTTIASALAVRAARDFKRVTMLDLNVDQGTLTNWWMTRGKPDNPHCFSDVDDVGETVGIGAMCTALDSFFRFVSDSSRDARVLQILYCGAASPKSEYRQTSVNIHQRQQDDVAAWVRAGIANGEIRKDADPKSIAAQYIAYISGMTYLWLINPKSIDFEKANEDMKEHLRLSLINRTGK